MKAKTISAFKRATGGRMVHITARENLLFIRSHGLMSAHDLARDLGIAADALPLRENRVELAGAGRRAVLNHQLPILFGRRAAASMLEGHDLRSWAEALDRRVFFWPERKGARFAASIDRERPVAVIWIDAVSFAEAMFDSIDLAPINTGNFTQGGAHARRGDWIYVPLAKGLSAFRENRRRRLGRTSADSVAEISTRRSVPPDLLKDILLEVEA